MKRVLLIALFMLVLLGLFIGAVFSIKPEDLWLAFSSVAIGWTILYILIGFVNFGLYVKRWDVIAHAGKEKDISFWDMMGIRYVTYAVSYLIPSAQVGGEPFRVLFLQERGFSKKLAISSVIIDKVFEAAIILIFSLVAFAMVVIYTQGVPSEVYSFFLLFGVLLLFFSYFYLTIVGEGFFTTIFRTLRLDKIKVLAPYEEKIMGMEAMMKKFFKHHVKELLWTILITMMTYVLFLLEYYVLLIALGVRPTMGQLLIVSTVPMVSYLIPVPGAAGALEASQWLSLQFARIDPALTLPIIVILRLRDFMFIAVGLLYASRHGIKLMSKEINKTSEALTKEIEG